MALDTAEANCLASASLISPAAASSTSANSVSRCFVRLRLTVGSRLSASVQKSSPVSTRGHGGSIAPSCRASRIHDLTTDGEMSGFGSSSRKTRMSCAASWTV
jgi:hypothetical protein